MSVVRVQQSTPTPSPPPERERERDHSPQLAAIKTDGIAAGPPHSHSHSHDALSPLSANFPPKTQYASLGSLSPPKASPRAPASAAASLSPYSPMFSENGDASSGAGSATTTTTTATTSPFNFQPQQYAPGRPAQIKADLGRRRGHKYKHSSVSHQIFLEPAPKTPLPLPSALPIPTAKEFRTSLSAEQRLRGLWCCAHLLVAAYVQWSAHGSLAMTALSHLLFFDATGAFLCVAVDVGANFEVWKRCSIRHPFGLERAEVLAGLALSIGLLFMGLDLASHSLQHALESAGGAGHDGHPHHSQHHNHRAPAGSVDVAALAAIAATLTSASALKNHERIGRALRFELPLPALLANPTHLLTLSCSALLLLLPLLSLSLYTWLDGLLAAVIAAAMGALGARLCYALGRMLLMSFPGPPDQAGGVVAELERDGAVEAVDEARFWQVHYGLCMANLKIRLRSVVGGGRSIDDDVARVRERISSLVRNRLGGGYGGGRGGVKWEVSTQIMLSAGAHAHGRANGHVHAGGAAAPGHRHGHGHGH